MFFIYAVLWMIVSIVVGTFKFGTQVPNKYLIFSKIHFNNEKNNL
jgi:hypothetical protein